MKTVGTQSRKSDDSARSLKTVSAKTKQYLYRSRGAHTIHDTRYTIVPDSEALMGMVAPPDRKNQVYMPGILFDVAGASLHKLYAEDFTRICIDALPQQYELKGYS